MEAVLALPEVTRAVVAEALGYISIGFWLFAQAPQVVKNARLASCEGLALPFLINWLFGDITNLVGCILTDQLPFQTYLAAYFCVIDFTLVGQYFYYRPSPPPPIYRTTSHLYTSSPNQSLLIHTAPASHVHKREREHSQAQSRVQQPVHNRTRSYGSVPHPTLQPLSASTTSTVRPQTSRAPASFGNAGEASTSAQSSIYRGREPHLARQDNSYAAIYEAALDVARAAERAEMHREHSQSRSRTRRTRNPSHRQTGNTVMPDVDEDAVSPVLGARSAMFDSFHSDMSAMTDASGSSAQEGQGDMAASSTSLLARGRSLQRATPALTLSGAGSVQAEEEGGDIISGLPGEGGRGVVQMRETRSRSKSRGVSMARASSGRGSGRRAAGVAFMSLGMIAGWSGLGRGAKLRHGGGAVLARPANDFLSLSHPISHPMSYLPSAIPHLPTPTADTGFDTTFILVEHPSGHDHPGPPIDRPPDYKRIIGRISAWACTTLYLTSRLPQIWKNFERKSVEGLSMLLFLFAFCGNTAYVASIVYNPAASLELPDASQYLLEALPYLLGSGGTLLFDLTILTQALMYGSAPPVPQTTIERSSFRKPIFRRRLRQAEEGRAVSTSAHGSRAFGERQPLLSSSIVMHSGGRRSGTIPLPPSRESRPRSISADVLLGDGTWRAGSGGGIAGLRRVEPGASDEERGESDRAGSSG